MSIRKKKTKSGISYQVRYRDPTGREVAKNFSTQRAAIAFEAAETTKIRRGEWTDPRLTEVPFESWARDWLASDPGKRDTTMARDEIVVRCHLIPAFKKRLINQITPMDVQKLVNKWAAELSAETVLRQYRTLSAIMRSAYNCDLIVKTPCRAIKLPKVKRREPKILDGTDLKKLADGLGAFGSMAYIGAVLGLRWGEVAGLRVKDIDLVTGKLRVEQQVSRGKSGEPLISEPKTRSAVRTLAMPAPLVAALEEHFEACELNPSKEKQLVFADEIGGPLSYSNWRRRVWVPACEQANLAGLGFHDLRRTNATAMVAAGVDIKTAQHRLGHADPRMTLSIYAQITDEGDSNAANRLGETFMSAHVDSANQNDVPSN